MKKKYQEIIKKFVFSRRVRCLLFCVVYCLERNRNEKKKLVQKMCQIQKRLKQ